MIGTGMKLNMDFSQAQKGLKKHKDDLKETATAWEKILNLNKRYEKQTQALHKVMEKHNATMKKLDKGGATPITKGVEMVKFGGGMLGAAMKDPFSLLIRGAGLLKHALMALTKIGWLAVLTAAITVFTGMWNANIGGIQRTFFQVWGRIQSGVGRVTAAFYEFVRSVGPVVEPFFKMIADLIMPIIDAAESMVLQFLKSGGAANLFKAAILPPLQAILGLAKVLIESIKNIAGGLFSTGATGENAFGKLFKSISKLMTSVVKLVTSLLKLAPVQLLFKAIGFVVNLIALGLGVVADVITFIVDLIVQWFDFLGKIYDIIFKILGLKKDDTEEDKKKAAAVQQTSASQQEILNNYNSQQSQTTINNNQQLAINSSGPITPGNAQSILDVAAGYMTVQKGTM